MSVHIYETGTHVFELTITPGVSGRCRREASVRLLSGEPLTNEQWGRLKEMVVRQLIGVGCRVYGVAAGYDEPGE